MNSRQAIRLNLDMSKMICDGYLGDLSDADLLVRPIPGTNHIAWQLGHIISSEHQMISAFKPGVMPALPAGFAERHAKATATSDNPGDFLTKAQYLELAEKVRAGTLAALEGYSDADLDAPSPEKFRGFWPTVGALLSMQGSHWMMHAGQWAIVRRKLGRPPLF